MPILTTVYMDEAMLADLTSSFLPPGPGLRALYLLDEGAGTTIHDSSGNALDGTLGIGNNGTGQSPVNYSGGYAHLPTWSSTGLVFDGTMGCAIPAPVWRAGDHSVYALATPTTATTTLNQSVFGWSGTVSNGTYFGYSFLDGTPLVGEDIVSPFYGAVVPMYGGTVATGWLYHAGGTGPTAGSVYVGGTDQSGWDGYDATVTDAAFAQGGPQNYCWLGCWYPAFNGLIGTLHIVAIFEGLHTSSQASAVMNWLASQAFQRGLSLSPQLQLPAGQVVAALGDSIARSARVTGSPWGSPYGGNANPSFWWKQLRAAMSGSYGWINRAIGGTTTAENITIASQAFQALLTGHSGQVAVVIQTGHNNSFTPFSDFAALVNQLHSAGATYVIGETGLPSSTLGSGGETNRQSWNTSMRANPFGSWFAVADSGGDATIGPAWSSGLLAYYPDGTHPNDACDTIRVGYIRAALASKGFN